MIILEGRSVYKGIAYGRLIYYKKPEVAWKYNTTEKPQEELLRFEAGRKTAIEQLEKLYLKALSEVGEKEAMILSVHQMLLEDMEYRSYVQNIIEEQKGSAEYAIACAREHFMQMFSSMEDDYMRERAADMKDISERLILALGEEDSSFELKEPVIIAAKDLVPSETIQLDRSKILAFLTREGSVSSHTAILARTMNIPAIIGIGEGLLEEYDGKQVLVDGISGRIYIEPEEALLQSLLEKKEQEEHRKASLLELKGMDNITRSGQRIDIYANIGEVGDVPLALKNDAGGIGLMRSEFLYLNHTTFPTEEEQFTVYRKILEEMGGREVVIRTLDIGADKKIDYFHLPKEENPALGYRAIRICLTEQDIFRTQLRALFRASIYGKLAIMFPMIISVEEVREIKQIVGEVKDELRREGKAYDDGVELGIMVETPAAAVISDLLAEEVDFFSIGTNDLTQYTTAIDRQNRGLERFHDPHHPAVLRLIMQTVENAHKNGIRVGICGELAADLSMTETFLQMGVDELSVSPGMILEVRKRVREIGD